MSRTLIISIPGLPPIEWPLVDGRVILGSDPSCHLHVDFHEIAPRAANIEVRGGAVFLQNLNGFPIYVGQQELAPQTLVEWPPDQPVQLTHSVSLSLADHQADAAEGAEGADPGKARKSTIQIAVICLCAILGYYLLVTDDSSNASYRQLDYTFGDLITEFESTLPMTGGRRDFSALSYEDRTTLDYLTEARTLDQRFGKTDPQRAIAAYELLIKYRPIRDAEVSSDTLRGRIKSYAAARLDDLSAR
jgi:hypothetical protein